MSVRTDVVNLQVNIKGNQAQKDLGDLRKKAADIKFEMQGLKKGTAEYIAKANELSQATKKMDDLKRSIGLTSLSLKELRQEQSKLTALMSSTVPFSGEYKKYQEQLGQVNKRIFEVKNGVTGFSAVFAKISMEIKQFGVLAAGYLGLQFITQQFSNLVTGAGKLSDSLAAIRKVSGLTASEVKGLNEEFKKIDTRTSTQHLRDLAVEAGKLGIEGKENILGFVRAADQIRVALGEDLGEEAVTAIGKLVNIFGLDKTFGLEQSLLKVGSAINDIGANSSASEPYIVDFVKRLGGIAPSAKISIQDLVALAGTMDSLGQTSEVSTTAIGGVLAKLVTDFEGFAKIASVSAQSLKSAFQNMGGIEALKVVLKGVKDTGGSFEELVAKLGDVGIEGSRAKSVLSVLANNLGELGRQQKIANDSFESGTSISNEFNIQNQTLGATLDKLSKEFNRLISSEAVQNFLKGAIEGAYKFVLAIRGIPKFIEENRIAVLTLIAGLVLLNKSYILSALATIRDTVVKIANAVATRAIAAANLIAISSTAAYITVTNLLTGRITLATAAQRLYNIALSIGTKTIGGIVVAAGLLAIAFTSLFRKTVELSNQERLRAEINAKVAESTQEQIEKISLLTKVAGDHNISLDNRKKALDALIAINPSYLKGLNLQNITTANGTKLINEYILSLRSKAEIEAKIALRNAKLQERTDVELRLPRLRTDAKNQNPFLQLLGDNFGFGANNTLNESIDQLDALNSDLKTLNKEIETVAKQDITKVLGDLKQDTSTVEDAVSDKTKEKVAKIKKKAEEHIKRIIQAAKINPALITIPIKVDVDALDESDGPINNRRIRDQLDKVSAELADTAKKQIGGRKAGLELDILTSSGRKNRDARIAQLQFERDEELANVTLTQEQAALIKEKYRKSESLIITESFIADVDLIIGFTQKALAVLDAFDQARTNRENAELSRDKRINDQKRKNLDNQLRSRLISQNQYNIALAGLDDEYDKKKKAIEIRQFKRNQKMQIAQGMISGAQGILSVLAAVPGPVDILSLGTIRTIQLALTAAVTGAQVAAIASQKPPEGRRGLIVPGPSHEKGGVDLVERNTGKKLANVEGGEPLWVFSRDTYRNNKPILDELIKSSMFRKGASIMPHFKNAYIPVNANKLVPMMKDGGIVNRSSGDSSDDEGHLIMLSMRNEIAELRSDMNSWNRELTAKVSLRDLNEKTSLLDAARSASGLNQ